LIGEQSSLSLREVAEGLCVVDLVARQQLLALDAAPVALAHQQGGDRPAGSLSRQIQQHLRSRHRAATKLTP
jgi:hypothetical protein